MQSMSLKVVPSQPQRPPQRTFLKLRTTNSLAITFWFVANGCQIVAELEKVIGFLVLIQVVLDQYQKLGTLEIKEYETKEL